MTTKDLLVYSNHLQKFNLYFLRETTILQNDSSLSSQIYKEKFITIYYMDSNTLSPSLQQANSWIGSTGKAISKIQGRIFEVLSINLTANQQSLQEALDTFGSVVDPILFSQTYDYKNYAKIRLSLPAKLPNETEYFEIFNRLKDLYPDLSRAYDAVVSCFPTNRLPFPIALRRWKKYCMEASKKKRTTP